MVLTWYVILTFLLTGFILLEGFDIGAGMLLYVVGNNDAQRREIVDAIGPLWTWSEVWLVAFGGTLLLAFPSVLAASFAGFYLALFLLLWSLVLRGVSLEFCGIMKDSLWRSAWDTCFVTSNVLLAILIGAALGNILRGVPLTADGTFALPFFTDFSPTGDVGILDWYTISIALFMLLIFAAHGAARIAAYTQGAVRAKSAHIATRLWCTVAVMLVVVTLESWWVHSDLIARPFLTASGWLGMICVIAGLASVMMGIRGSRATLTNAGSSTFITGLMILGATAVFPNMLRSTVDAQFSLSAYQAAAGRHGMFVALIWWPVAMILSIGYFTFIHKNYRGRLRDAPISR